MAILVCLKKRLKILSELEVKKYVFYEEIGIEISVWSSVNTDFLLGDNYWVPGTWYLLLLNKTEN